MYVLATSTRCSEIGGSYHLLVEIEIFLGIKFHPCFDFYNEMFVGDSIVVSTPEAKHSKRGDEKSILLLYMRK